MRYILVAIVLFLCLAQTADAGCGIFGRGAERRQARRAGRVAACGSYSHVSGCAGGACALPQK